MRVQFNVKFVSFLAPSYLCLLNPNGLIHFNLCMSQYAVRSVLVSFMNHFDWLVYSCCSSVKLFVSLQFLSIRLLRRVIIPSQGRYLTENHNKHKQISMPRVGCEPTILAFKRSCLRPCGHCDRNEPLSSSGYKDAAEYK
jgi:hypothetical protein